MSKITSITVREAAVRLSCTLTHVYNLVRAERLTGAYKEDGEWKIPLTSLKGHEENRSRHRKVLSRTSHLLGEKPTHRASV